MKLIRFFYIAVVTLAMVWQGCEQDANNVKLPEASPKLVLMSFISPQDTMLVANIRTTQPVVGIQKRPEELMITDATVILSDGVQSVELTHSSEPGKYAADPARLPILAGKTYFLTVTTPDGKKAEASCTVPSADGVSITEMTITSQKPIRYDNMPYKQYYYSFKWQDAPGHINYYHLAAFMKMNYNQSDNQSGVYYQPVYFYGKESLIDDQGRDGKIQISPDVYLYSVPTSGDIDSNYPKPLTIYTILSITDQHYYRYHKSIYDQGEAEGNPFAEPVLIYSNVQGGLGAFGAYNQILAEKQVPQ